MFKQLSADICFLNGPQLRKCKSCHACILLTHTQAGCHPHETLDSWCQGSAWSKPGPWYEICTAHGWEEN